MSEVDWECYADALSEAFPDLRFYLELDYWDCEKPEPPPLKLYNHLLETGATWRNCVIGVFDKDWQPQFKKSWPDLLNHPSKWRWGFRLPKFPYLRIDLGCEMSTPAKPLAPGEGTGAGCIDVYCTPGNREQAAVMRKVFSLVSKFASNRNQGYIHNGKMTVHEKGSLHWIGYAAMAWAR